MKFFAALAVFGLFESALSQYTTGSGTVITGTKTGTTTTVTRVAVPDFPTANINNLLLGSTNQAVTEATISNVIRSASNEISTAVRSFESLFTRHPSKTELNKFADDGDTAAISRTLQNLASDDSVPCQAKVNYLLELLGTIKAAIARKNLAADQLQAIITGARAQIARLQSQIARVQRLRDALGLTALNAKLNEIVARLRPIYDQINALKVQIPPEEARIAGFQKQIDTLTEINDGQRNRQSNDRLKLAQTDNLIKDLEGRLADARAQKAALEASIAASDATIRDNNNKINNIRATIAEIQSKIRRLQDAIDQLNRNANTLQVDQERARTDLSVGQAKDNGFLDEIRSYQNRINLEEPKLVDDQLRKIKTLIGNLNRSLPEVQEQIDRQYYYCYGAGKVQTVKANNVIVYVVRGQAFGQYIQTAYGQSIRAPNVRTGTDYRLQIVDPFSQIWTAKYGFPQVAPGFTCFAGSSSAGTGVISSINGGTLVVDADGNRVNLNIGGCSRLEAADDMPKPGHTIAWRGVPSSNGGYNIFSGTCW